MKYPLVLFLGITLLTLFVSCSEQTEILQSQVPVTKTSSGPVIRFPPSVSPTAGDTPVATRTPQWYELVLSTPVVADPWAVPSPYPTEGVARGTMIESTVHQITDGKLILYAREISPACHQILKNNMMAMEVEFAFVNTAEESLLIRTRFAVTRSGLIKSDINPLYYTETGKFIVLDSWMQDDTPLGQNNSFVEIPPEKHYSVSVMVPLPRSLDAGKYYIKFVYRSPLYSESQREIWTGMISSNLVELCLEN